MWIWHRHPVYHGTLYTFSFSECWHFRSVWNTIHFKDYLMTVEMNYVDKDKHLVHSVLLYKFNKRLVLASPPKTCDFVSHGFLDKLTVPGISSILWSGFEFTHNLIATSMTVVLLFHSEPILPGLPWLLLSELSTEKQWWSFSSSSRRHKAFQS